MKKIMLAVALFCAGMCFGQNITDHTDVYDVTMSLKMPVLDSGVRVYKAQSFKGIMKLAYVDTDMTATMCVTNKKTKVAHTIDMTEAMYNLMGRGNKQTFRDKPTVYFMGADAEETLGHEVFKTITFSGYGAVKSTKESSGSCGACGDITSSVYCTRLTSMSGSVVGVVNCQCDDDIAWSHTLIAGACGVLEGDLETIRTRDASTWGTWSAKWNKKLTAAEND